MVPWVLRTYSLESHIGNGPGADQREAGFAGRTRECRCLVNLNINKLIKPPVPH